ncbi:MAG: tRNA (guanosine(46)-N7)-methyltransferase TrmB [Buchnera aphidicola (Eriosoma harunire)]
MLNKKICCMKNVLNNDCLSKFKITTSRRGRLTRSHIKAIEEFYPVFCIPFQHKVLDFVKIFCRVAPICIEIGFGTGENLLHIARQYSEINFVGIEVYWPGIAVCLKKVNLMNLKNLRIICYNACDVMKFMISDNQIQYIQLLFPDPWPKRKHQHRRIIEPGFLLLLGNKLKKYGILQISTDWESYAVDIINYVKQIKCFLYCNNMNQDELISRIETKFEIKGKKLGHKIFDLVFQYIGGKNFF